MSFWQPDNLRLVTSGRWAHRPPAPAPGSVDLDVSGVSTDSRTIQRGQIFVALRGERFDGHDYLKQAMDGGAALAIVDRQPTPGSLANCPAGVLLVEDTYAALGRLAAAYRKTLNAEVIAVTGSVGKTTTKQLIHAVLSQTLRGSASPRSYNNRIGVPLTLLNVNPKDRYVIVEVGTNAPGEIGALAKIVEPDVAVITQVGLAHVEKLGTLADIAAEKAGLLRCLRENGVVIVNGDVRVLDERLRNLRRIVRFGRSERCDLRLTDCKPTGRGVKFTVNGRATFELPMMGEHNAVNALAAIAVARHLNLNDTQIAAGLAKAQQPAMRLNIRHLGGDDNPLTLINDAYNANPQSMAAAIDVLAAMPCEGGRRVAVLGDMAELGHMAEQLHRELGQKLAASNIDAAVLIGPLSMHTAQVLGRSWAAHRIHAMATWTEKTADEVASLLRAGDVALIKASRASALERLVPAIEQRFGSSKSEVKLV